MTKTVESTANGGRLVRRLTDTAADWSGGEWLGFFKKFTSRCLTSLPPHQSAAVPVCRRSPSGFTLIEVLLALGMSAILASALYGLLWTGIGSWKRMRSRAELYQTARIVLERLETDLQHQVPLYGGAMKDLSPFKGAPQQLTFPAALRLFDASQPSRQRTAVGTVSYTWKSGEAGGPGQLLREWTAYVPEASMAFPSQGSEPFPPAVTGITFAYPMRQAEPAAPSFIWEDHWEETRKLPEGVRVDLMLQEPRTGETLTLRKIVQVWQGMPHVKAPS